MTNNLPKHGYTLLEFIAAMVILGIALAGLFPLMVMQSRGIESLELRYTQLGKEDANWFKPVLRSDTTRLIVDDDRQNYRASDTSIAWYLAPSPDPLARKLGAAATLSRNVPSAAAVSLVDDGDASYSETGSPGAWSAGVGGFDNDYHRHETQATPTDAATWTFTNVPVGQYYVMATWTEAVDLSTVAQYTIDDNGASPITVYLNQTAAPSGATYQNRPWQSLTTKYFSGGTAHVRLSTDAMAAVVADAVRLVPVAAILSLDKSFNNEEVTVRVRIGAAP